MTIERRYPPATDPLATFTVGSNADRRAQVQREQQELAAERQRQLASQASPLTEPEERIKIWERLHSLSLPQLGTHKLVRVIAAQTELTVQQVQQEQLRRQELAKSDG